jgi:hypothetical protein
MGGGVHRGVFLHMDLIKDTYNVEMEKVGVMKKKGLG